MMIKSKRRQRTIERAPGPIKVASLLIIVAMTGLGLVSFHLGTIIKSNTSTLKEDSEAKMMAEFKRFYTEKRPAKSPRPMAPMDRMYPKWIAPAHVPAGRDPLAPQILPTFQSPEGGAFVHIGKTGGSALSVLLRNGCHSWMPHPCRNVTQETRASELIESYYHVPDFAFLLQSHHDFYLMTMRDPFDRTVSAFVYEHVLNRYARGEKAPVKPDRVKAFESGYQCFPTLEKFSSFLEGNASMFYYPYKKRDIVPEPCKDFARAALAGKIRPFHHFYFNYQRIKSFIPDPEHQVLFVTRQEFLWEDWKQINKLLGQTTPIFVPSDLDHREIRNFTHWKLPVTRDISSRGTEILCKALQTEYETYIWFLKQAKNIKEQDILHSIERAQKRCPHLQIDLHS